jgi:hypothetical protein
LGTDAAPPQRSTPSSQRAVAYSPHVAASSTAVSNSPQQPAELSLEKISPLIEKISEKYLAAQLVERKRNDELQLNAINSTLKKWAEQVNTEIKKSQSAQSSGVDKANSILESAVGDSKDRQSKIIDEIKEAHKKQLDILRQAMAEERQLAQQAQQVFEETLQTKYDSMVSALQVKIRAEQEASMQVRKREIACIFVVCGQRVNNYCFFLTARVG